MHYELSCFPLSNTRPVTFGGQEYPSLSECPDWVDGVIARTAYAYLSDAARHQTPVEVAARRLHDITGQAEAFSCYLALTLIEAGDEQDLIDYALTAINDLDLKHDVKFAYSNILEKFQLASYHSYLRKSPETLHRLEFFKKIDTYPFQNLAIAFDDAVMAKRLVEKAGNKFDYTLSFLAAVTHYPYRDSKVRSYLISHFGDIRDHEIKLRLSMQKVMMSNRMKSSDYPKLSLDEAPPYAFYDFKDAAVLDLKVFQMPGIREWLEEVPGSIELLAENLNYSSVGKLEGRAASLIPYFDQALDVLFESKMPVDQIYMQACQGYDRAKVELARQFHSSEQELHRDIYCNLISKLKDNDPLCNHIAKTFIKKLGLPYFLDLMQNQDDLLVIARHIRDASVMKRLSPEQRDSLMGHDIGL